MENTTIASVKSDSNEVTQAEIQAVETALRNIDTVNLAKQILAAASNWVLVLKMFREVELGYLALENRSVLEGKYRALLTSLMGFGDLILSTANDHPALDFSVVGMTRGDLTANVRYLREKYEQWFVPTYDREGEEILTRLKNERPAAD